MTWQVVDYYLLKLDRIAPLPIFISKTSVGYYFCVTYSFSCLEGKSVPWSSQVGGGELHCAMSLITVQVALTEPLSIKLGIQIKITMEPTGWGTIWVASGYGLTQPLFKLGVGHVAIINKNRDHFTSCSISGDFYWRIFQVHLCPVRQLHLKWCQL